MNYKFLTFFIVLLTTPAFTSSYHSDESEQFRTLTHKITKQVENKKDQETIPGLPNYTSKYIFDLLLEVEILPLQALPVSKAWLAESNKRLIQPSPFEHKHELKKEIDRIFSVYKLQSPQSNKLIDPQTPHHKTLQETEFWTCQNQLNRILDLVFRVRIGPDMIDEDWLRPYFQAPYADHFFHLPPALFYRWLDFLTLDPQNDITMLIESAKNFNKPRLGNQTLLERINYEIEHNELKPFDDRPVTVQAMQLYTPSSDFDFCYTNSLNNPLWRKASQAWGG